MRSLQTGLGFGEGPRTTEVVTDQLVLWHKLDEGSGTISYDSAPWHINGTIVGNGFWDNMSPDGKTACGTFNGSTNYIKGLGTQRYRNTGLTIVAAVCPQQVAGQWHTIHAKGKGGDSADVNYSFSRIVDSNELRFAATEGIGGWETCDTSDFNMVDGTWYIITLVFTFGTLASVKIYKNTTEVSLVSWDPGAQDLYPPGGINRYVRIGSQDNTGDDSGEHNLWKGRRGDVMQYSKALSYNDILANFDVLRGRYGL